MISERLYERHRKEHEFARAEKQWYRNRKIKYLEQYEEMIRNVHRKNRKIWKLERTEEGYTRIRKVRL